MKTSIDGKALVLAEGMFNTLNGKTAHGLVRYTERYEVLGVIESRYAGQDAGMVLDRKPKKIPIFKDLSEAIEKTKNDRPGTLVIGLAPDGGRLPDYAREIIKSALKVGLNVDNGLHDFLYKDAELMEIAHMNNCRIRDIRRTPDRDELHFFTGKIEDVDCLKIAVLGTDSAIGKRTTAWVIVREFRKQGLKAEMIGTGQTTWLQGAKYTFIMDSCINDFVAGEIEHYVYEAWKNEAPDILVIEGQGSLMNPAYPGGFEILAAGRPDYVIMQHAPMRLEYDGFPGYVLHPLNEQINAIQTISGKKVIAVTVNHEHMSKDEILPACKKITKETGLPAFDVLEFGGTEIVDLLKPLMK